MHTSHACATEKSSVLQKKMYIVQIKLDSELLKENLKTYKLEIQK
jgi:hypothetical protein